MTEERALATVEEITEIRPIENADAIEVARVRGWDVVVRKDEFKQGDLVVYFEIDSFLPLDDARFTFLAPRGARKNQEGVEGHVLKTAKLRGVYSQGLVLPYDQFENEVAQLLIDTDAVATLGLDLTPYIKGLEKWDPPIPAELAGSARGGFPSGIRKTDEERIQNFTEVPRFGDERDAFWTPTEKIDGSSMTVWVTADDQGVASRNWDIEDTKFNSMWNLTRELRLHERIRESFRLSDTDPYTETTLGGFDGAHTIAVQGEIFGPGIQGNPLNVKTVQFRAFTLQVNGSSVPRDSWPLWLVELSVPTYDLPYPETADEAIAQVETLKSLIEPDRAAEGVVWRNTIHSSMPNGSHASWKAISQRYLMKHDR